MIKLKNIFLLIIVITIITPAFNPIQAQGFDGSESIAFVDFTEFEKQNTKYDSQSNLAKSEAERKAKAEAYDRYVSADFGSYLNPYNGTLSIVNNKDKHYTNAQFLSKSSNENIFSIKIDKDTQSIDISKYEAGDYILILSNDEGDILAEDFIII